MVEECTEASNSWNRKGERCLHDGDLYRAADFFRRSLYEDPCSFKAQSNLAYVESLIEERESILFPHGNIDQYKHAKKAEDQK
jgi:hypothetical protein